MPFVPLKESNDQTSAAWPVPKLRLEAYDLQSPGTTRFFVAVNPVRLMRDAVLVVLKLLYTPDTVPHKVRSITLFPHDFNGVAYTRGSELDDDHKEIHLSTNYVNKISVDRIRDEIIGVITHEVVHCFQYNGKGTCPGGLIEGIADYVRLKAGLAPPHWRRRTQQQPEKRRWDEGYEKTGFFLEWLERTDAEGSVGRTVVRPLNLKLAQTEYNEDLFELVTGRSVGELWRQYERWLDAGGDRKI